MLPSGTHTGASCCHRGRKRCWLTPAEPDAEARDPATNTGIDASSAQRRRGRAPCERISIFTASSDAPDKPSTAVADVEQSEGVIATTLRETLAIRTLSSVSCTAYPTPQSRRPASAHQTPPKKTSGENRAVRATAQTTGRDTDPIVRDAPGRDSRPPRTRSRLREISAAIALSRRLLSTGGTQ